MRTRTITLTEREWFKPSPHPRMTQDEMVAFARTLVWQFTYNQRGDNSPSDWEPVVPPLVELPCPCCMCPLQPEDLLQHVIEGDPECDRVHWGEDFFRELHVGF